MSVDLVALTPADFESRIGDDFRIATSAGAVELKLAEVHQLGASRRKGGAFSLMFLSPPGPFLPQAIYPLENSALGTLELFIVPLGPKDGRNSYEAIFA